MLLTRSVTGHPIDETSLTGIVLFDTTKASLETSTGPNEVLYPSATPAPSTPGPAAVSSGGGVGQETYTLVKANLFYLDPSTDHRVFPTSFIDQNLTPGHFYYYSLFVFSLEEATPAWRLAGHCIGLIPTEYGYGDRMFELLPEVHRSHDMTVSDDQVNGPLQRYLQLLGSQFDLVRTEYETLRDVRRPATVSGGLLPLLASLLGTDYEGGVGMAQTRYKLTNIVHLYKLKGTRLGVEGIAEAVSGYAASADVSYNLLYDKNISSMFEPPATPQGATPQAPVHWRGKYVSVSGTPQVRTVVARVVNPFPDHDKDDRPGWWLNNIDIDVRGTINIHQWVLSARRSTNVVVGVDDSIVITHAVSGLGHLTGVKIRPSRDDDDDDRFWDDDDDICRHKHTSVIDINTKDTYVHVGTDGTYIRTPGSTVIDTRSGIFIDTGRTQLLADSRGSVYIDTSAAKVEDGPGYIDYKTPSRSISVGVSGQCEVSHDLSIPSRQVRASLDYYDKNGVYISSSPTGPLVNTIPGSWVTVTVQHIPPSTAIYAALSVEWIHVGNIDIHIVKSIQIEVGCHRDNDDIGWGYVKFLPRVVQGSAPLTVSVSVANRTKNFFSWTMFWGDGTTTRGTGALTGVSFSHTYTQKGHYRPRLQAIERDGDIERGFFFVHISAPTEIFDGDHGSGVENGTLITLSPFALARDIRVRLAPTRANLIKNPSAETNTLGWTAPAGAVNLSRVATPLANPEAPHSAYVFQVSTNPSNQPPLATPISDADDIDIRQLFPVRAGATYALSAYVLSSGMPRNCWVDIEWLDPLGMTISKTTWMMFDHIFNWGQMRSYTWEQLEENLISNSPQVGRSNQWVRPSLVAVAPEMASQGYAHVVVQSPSPGELHYIDAVLLERRNKIDDYFDSSLYTTNTDYLWAGVPHNSFSYWYPHRATRNNRLNVALPQFIPTGSTFSLVYGSDS